METDEVDPEVQAIFDELNEELVGLPAPVVMAKVILKIWDILIAEYGDKKAEATKRINFIACDVSGLPAPNAISRLINHYVALRLGYFEDYYRKVMRE
jgi:hypothetical protein